MATLRLRPCRCAENEGGPERVRLVLGEDLAGEPFTRLLFELEHHRPPIAFDVRELAHGDAARLVRDGGADLALTLDGRERVGLVQVRGWAEPLVLVTSGGPPFAERDKVAGTEVSAESLALPRSSICPGYLAQIEALLERYGVRVPERVSIRHWNTAVSFASTGRALALVPTSFVHGATTVAVIPIAEPDAELVTWFLHPEELSSAASLVIEVAALIDGNEGVVEPALASPV